MKFKLAHVNVFVFFFISRWNFYSPHFFRTKQYESHFHLVNSWICWTLLDVYYKLLLLSFDVIVCVDKIKMKLISATQRFFFAVTKRNIFMKSFQHQKVEGAEFGAVQHNGCQPGHFSFAQILDAFVLVL